MDPLKQPPAERLLSAVAWVFHHGPELAAILAPSGTSEGTPQASSEAPPLMGRQAAEPASELPEPKAEALAEPISPPATQGDNGLTVARRNQTARQVLRQQQDTASLTMRQQRNRTAEPWPWKQLPRQLPWQQSLILALVRAAGKIGRNGLIAITGLTPAEVDAATEALHDTDYVQQCAYAAGMLLVPRTEENFD